MALEDRLLMNIDVFVGYARLARSLKVRFRRTLRQTIAEAASRIESEPGDLRDYIDPAAAALEGLAGDAWAPRPSPGRATAAAHS